MKYDETKCGTIHTFQGRGEDVVYFSTVLNNTTECVKHLNSSHCLFTTELINVAVSRAKEKFILVTDKNFFKQHNKNMKNLIEYIECYGDNIPDKAVCIFDYLYKKIPTYTQRIPSIDNPYEEKIYYLLQEFVKKHNYNLTWKLPLAELVTDKEYLNNNPELKDFILHNSHLDFIIYTTDINKPILVIELDGEDHKKEAQKIRDAKKDKILEHMEIPIIRIKSKDAYNKEDLFQIISELINKNYGDL